MALLMQRTSACQEVCPLSSEVVDELLWKTEATFQKLERARSSPVQLPRTELEIVKLFGILRDFMMALLQSECGDRVVLPRIFGGNCSRISRIRAVLEAIRLSEAARGDQRVVSCLNACKSVETVLGELGLGQALRTAQESHKKALAESLTTPAVVDEFQEPEAFAKYVNECGSLLHDSEAPGGAPLSADEPISPLSVCEPDPPISPDPPNQSGLTSAMEHVHKCADTAKIMHDGLFHQNELDTDASGKDNGCDFTCSPGVLQHLCHAQPLDGTPVLADPQFPKLIKSIDWVPFDSSQSRTICEPSPEPEVLEKHVKDVDRHRATSHGHTKSFPSKAATRRTPDMPDTKQKRASKFTSLHSQKASSQVFGRAQSPSCRTDCTTEKLNALQIAGDQSEGQLHKCQRALSSLSAAHQRLIRELFSHYVGPGGIPAGTGLGLSKFRRVLRDCSLLTDETVEVHDDEEMLVTTAQADLMLARAAGSMCPGVAQKLRTVEAFAHALAEVAVHVCPELAAFPDQAFDVFCDAVLVPLGARVLQGIGQDVRAAVVIFAEQEVAHVLRQCQTGMRALFASYASGIGAPNPYRRGHWTARDASRFATDAGLAADLSHSFLQQLFGACATYEASCGRGDAGKLSFDCFQLALVATSLRIYATTRQSPRHCLATLLRRIAVRWPGHHDIAVAARSATSTRE
jgi:hypothetical protein